MKLAVDTNVLVRYLVGDDAEEADSATAQIESADEIFISTIVLCETVRVLSRAYRYSNDEIVEALSGVIRSRNVQADRPAAEAGLRALVRGGEFADGVIEHDAKREDCDRIATFDQTFRRLLTAAPRRA